MRDTPVHVANERIKSVCGIMYNLASALIAAIAVQGYADGAVTRQVILWTFVAMILIFIPWRLQTLLEPEERS